MPALNLDQITATVTALRSLGVVECEIDGEGNLRRAVLRYDLTAVEALPTIDREAPTPREPLSQRGDGDDEDDDPLWKSTGSRPVRRRPRPTPAPDTGAPE